MIKGRTMRKLFPLCGHVLLPAPCREQFTLWLTSSGMAHSVGKTGAESPLLALWRVFRAWEGTVLANDGKTFHCFTFNGTVSLRMEMTGLPPNQLNDSFSVA